MNNICLIILAISVLTGMVTDILAKEPKKKSKYVLIEKHSACHELTSAADMAGKLIASDYNEILLCFEAYQQVPEVEKAYYAHKLMAIIKDHIAHKKLPLYGNFLNRTWKNNKMASHKFELQQFNHILIVDAIGHLEKYCTKLSQVGQSFDKQEHLLKKLESIKSLVAESYEYKAEQLQDKIAALEEQMADIKQELMQQKIKWQYKA